MVPSGEIRTLEQSLECQKYGIIVKAEVEWGEEIVQGKRPVLGMGDLREMILHLLTGTTNKPTWLKAAVRPWIPKACLCFASVLPRLPSPR